jgi:cell shape-determining protein MreC
VSISIAVCAYSSVSGSAIPSFYIRLGTITRWFVDAPQEKAIQERDELARRMRELEEENRRLLEQMQNVARDQGALTQQLQQERDRLQKLLNEEK